MQFTPTIGLEIHVELKTKTKMFCGCLNDPDERHPNINVCPICLGHPGILPTINKEAVKNVLKVGLALGGKIAEHSRFDRKNYFYPDLPKGYQISQYQHPLVSGGYLEIQSHDENIGDRNFQFPISNFQTNHKSQITNHKRIRITRIHLEEDAGKLIHETRNLKRETEKNVSSSKFQASSYIDFNRAGIPLMELVTEPDITFGKDAKSFCDEFQLVLRYLGVSDADMEKGQMRCEVNISLNMGTKVEIKNLNSFRAVEKTIDYEISRQNGILGKGEEIEQETRGWDDNKERTFSQRKKEEAHDYRYFPEPDLPSLLIFSEEKILQRGAPRLFTRSEKGGVTVLDLSEIRASIPELPSQKRERFKQEFTLKDEQIEILVRDKQLSDFFEDAISELNLETKFPSGNLVSLMFNYLTSDLVGLMNEKYLAWEDLQISPHAFGELMALISENKVSSRVAKDVLKIMIETGKDAKIIVQEQGLEQISDKEFIEVIVKKIIEINPKAINDYKKGKEEAIQFLIGQAMRETKGRANPETLKIIFEKNI